MKKNHWFAKKYPPVISGFLGLFWDWLIFLDQRHDFFFFKPAQQRLIFTNQWFLDQFFHMDQPRKNEKNRTPVVIKRVAN